jgi:fluoride exporter
MNQVFLVFIGGGLGSLARFGLGKLFLRWSSALPLGTLTANVLACLILGMFTGWATLKNQDPGSYRAFITVGFCGGFSTFSTFSNESIQLMINTQFGVALMNILLNTVLCFGAILLGLWLVK